MGISTSNDKINFKSFYRLSGSPDQRLILRRIAQVYGSGMIHDHKTETTIITSTSNHADKEIYRRFINIVNHGRKKAAMASAIFPELNAKTLKTGFWQPFADSIIARLDKNEPSITDGRTRLTRFAIKAAVECDIS